MRAQAAEPLSPAHARPHRVTGRHAGVELGRAVAMLFVVYIHASTRGVLHSVLSPIALFAAPYFFVASGYFFGQRAERTGDAAAAFSPLARKIGTLFVAWTVIYSLLPLDWLSVSVHGELLTTVRTTAGGAMERLFTQPLLYLFDGPPGGFHLWFLPALVMAAALVTAGLRLGWPRATAALALILFGVGLIGGAYSQTAVGFDLGFTPRNGPFQSTLLFGLGVALAHGGRAGHHARIGPALFVLGLAVAMIEQAALHPHFDTSPEDYSAATPLLGVGAFLTFYQLDAPPWARVIERLGGTTLGVYLVHVALRTPLFSVLAATGIYPRDGSNPWWAFVALYAASVAVVWAVQELQGGLFSPRRSQGGVTQQSHG